MRIPFLVWCAILTGCGAQKHNTENPAHVRAAELQLSNFGKSIELYQLDLTVLPEHLQDLVEPPANLPDVTRWRPYYDQAIPRDPWNNEYVYERHSDGAGFTLFSAGPDGEAGTADDIAHQR